jgi:anti-sigma B factor antagonist
MKVSIDEKFNAAVIELKGNLIGGDNAQLFRDKIYDLIKQNKQNIIVDMSDVKFVNSSGIGILISGFTTVKNAGGDLKLASISDKVQGVLGITKLNQIFSIYNSVDDAVKSYS